MNKRNLRKMVNAVRNGPELDDNVRPSCRECGAIYAPDVDLDPSALCHLCAQTYVVEFAEALHRLLKVDARVTDLEREVAKLKTSSVANAKRPRMVTRG